MTACLKLHQTVRRSIGRNTDHLEVLYSAHLVLEKDQSPVSLEGWDAVAGAGPVVPGPRRLESGRMSGSGRVGRWNGQTEPQEEGSGSGWPRRTARSG